MEGLDLKNAVGIEIGPLDKPLLTRGEGQVIYVDHADTNSLKAKYQNDPNVNTQNIVEVDAVWGQQTLQQAIGSDRKVDYIVASHVLEHVPDIIGWLDELHAVLNAGGEVRLAIPDRRFTFDYLRRETSLADIVNANIARARAPLPIAILDFVLNVSLVDNVKAWTGELRPEPMHPPSTAFQLAKEVSETGVYHDVHCWVFTPKSFVDLFASAAEAGLIGFECSRLYETLPTRSSFWLLSSPLRIKRML